MHAHYTEFAEQKYELIRQGRNLRREANIQAGKKVKYVLRPADALSEYEIEVMRLLLGAEAIEEDAQYQAKKGTPSTRSPLGELYLPLEGLIDVAAEKARLTKEVAKINGEIEKVQQKLNNPNFTQKVPPTVLEEHKRRLEEWQGKKVQAESALITLA